MKPVLGQTQPDPTGETLGTGFQQFSTNIGVGGLAREDEGGQRLYLLAVHSQEEGVGQFTSFITYCQCAYKEIYVMHIENPKLEAMLARRGFKPEEGLFEGEYVTGMMWVQ